MPHRSTAAAVITALALLGTAPTAQSREADFVPARDPVPGSFLVSLVETGRSAAATSSSLAGRYGGRVKTVFTAALHGFLVRGLTEAQARRLAADPAVRKVHQDGTARAATDGVATAGVHAAARRPADPHTTATQSRATQSRATQSRATWGIDRVDQRSLPLDHEYDYRTTASEVTTYVLDSGIRRTHAEFEGRASDGHDFVDDDAVAQDCHGHGTHVAGTIGGRTWGVAKKIRLVAVRMLGCGGSAPDSAGVEGIEWIARNAVEPAVVNGSFTFDTPGIGDEAIGGLTAAGIAFVAAAGNDSADACGAGPARNPDVIAVGATDEDDERARFSNHGSCVDLFAPGDSITSASHRGDTASTTMSGTSMASPHVAGGAALYLAGHPTATPAQVLEALTGAATPGVVRDPGPGSPNRLLHTASFGAEEPGCEGGRNDDDVPVPDAGAAVTSTVEVAGCPGAGTATTRVAVDIAHPYPADLVVDLVGPGGAVFPLRAAGEVGSPGGLHETFAVDTSSQPRDGAWRLRVRDAYAHDTGKIEGWGLTF
ncbi:S8 family serine peptidase [Saccharothrix sp. BKS2]|uniref:S8 family peptidase n=1 Tax=Saccharothrix sp. BKS2 TaxID=3064400 RepID=UPI0039EC6F0F